MDDALWDAGVDFAHDNMYVACRAGMTALGGYAGAGLAGAPTFGLGAVAGGALGLAAGAGISKPICAGIFKAPRKIKQENAVPVSNATPADRVRNIKQTVMKHQQRFVPKNQAEKLFQTCRSLSEVELSDKEVRRLASACQYGKISLSKQSINSAVNHLRKTKST